VESTDPFSELLAELPPRRADFVARYLVDRNATKAAIAAGYSEHSARAIGSELLTFPDVRAAVNAGLGRLRDRSIVDAEAAVQRMWDIANADVRELVEYRRTCCRHCHGEGFGYQFTAPELAKREADAKLAWQERKNAKPEDVFTFDRLGGDGYDKRKDPHPGCPVCFGEGVEDVFVHDTRKLSPAAAALYAGVKRTKDGIEVKIEDRQAALVTMFKHLGLIVDKTELTGANGAPMELAITHTIVDAAATDAG
jgi:hypothetical protein